MSASTFLVPLPDKSGRICRVVVVGKSDDGSTVRVLNIDEISRNPALLKQFGPGYAGATTTWSAVASIVLVGGIIASFFWQWWAFLPGIFLAMMIFRANRRSVGDFAIEIIQRDSAALARFAEFGLVWDAPAASVMPER